MTITKAQTAKIKAMAAALWRRRDGRFLHALRQPLDPSKVREMVGGRAAADPVLPALPAICRRDDGHRERPVLPRASGEVAADGAHRAGLFRAPAYIDALAQSVERAYAALEKRPTSWSVPTTACRSAT
jgi:protoporphyrin/coproporphyrin ferrochelatase